MNPLHTCTRVLLTASIAASICASILVSSPRAQMPAPAGSMVGVWNFNKDSSDVAPGSGERGDGRGRSGGPGRGGGGGGRGGFRGGFGGGGMGRGGGRGNPEEMRRMRDAMRDIMEPPARLTITQTESMVIITTGEGKTTRLSLDGARIKDESTGIERKTRWEAGALVSEISGVGPGKMTETYRVTPDPRQLTVTLEFERSGNDKRPPMRRVYDPEP